MAHLVAGAEFANIPTDGRKRRTRTLDCIYFIFLLIILFYFFHIEVSLEVALPQTDREKMGICSYLTVPWKSIVVLGLKLLLLVPAGVPARSGDSVLKDNITVRQGDSAVLK